MGRPPVFGAGPGPGMACCPARPRSSWRAARRRPPGSRSGPVEGRVPRSGEDCSGGRTRAVGPRGPGRGPGPAGAGHPPRTSTTRPPESSRPPRRPKPCSTGSRRWTVPPTPGRARPPRSRRSPTTAGRSGRSGPGTSSPPTPSRVTSAPVSEPERASQSLKHERLHRERIDDALDLAREADAHRAGVNTVRPHQAPARNRPQTPTAARPTRPSPTLPTPKPCQPLNTGQRHNRAAQQGSLNQTFTTARKTYFTPACAAGPSKDSCRAVGLHGFRRTRRHGADPRLGPGGARSPSSTAP